MDSSDVLAIERLMSDFAWFADRGNGGALAELFLTNGTLIVGPVELAGRRQIANDCERRFADRDRKTRHLWSNLRIEHCEDNAIRTTAVQMTFEQGTPGTATQLRVNDVFDEFRKETGGAWRFARRTIKCEMDLALPAPQAAMPAPASSRPA